MIKIILCIVLMAALAGCAAFGLGSCGAGLEFGSGSGEGDGTGETKTESIQSEGHSASQDDSVVVSSDLTTDSVSENTVVEVTVLESDYFYENKRIPLDEVIEILKAMTNEVIVEVFDDNASLKAYSNLIDELESNNIDYIEK